MTDLPSLSTSIPSRLNVSVAAKDPLVLRMHPIPETSRLGSARASALGFLIDAVGGIAVDSDPDFWTFTSEMTIRMNPVPAPHFVDATGAVLREGRRSSTCEARLVDDSGAGIAYGALGFARVPRRADDPKKPNPDPDALDRGWREVPPIDVPLPRAAGIEVIDGPAGVVEVEIVDGLLNPAGALQGAMVALIAEVAAEEMISARWDRPALVCDLDIRYLAQGRRGPIRTNCEWLGDGDDAWVRIGLEDQSDGTLLTHVLARARDRASLRR